MRPAVLMYFWQPMNGTIWQVENETIQMVMWAAFGLGWVVPTMTVSHLVFALSMSAYVLIGIRFEEWAMVKAIDEAYLEYKKNLQNSAKGLLIH